jgi:lipopolysaccharide heptosyltransferase II
MKILIIRLSAMGDIILTTPIVRFIKSKYPDSKIDFLSSKQFIDIYVDNPYINKIISYDKSSNISQILNQKSELISEFGTYDIIIDLQNNLRSKIFKFGLGKSYYNISKKRLHKLMLVNFKRSCFETAHIVDNYYHSIMALKTIKDNLGTELFLDSIYDIIDTNIYGKKPIIAIAPGAHHFTKRMPVTKYIQIINSINSKIDCHFALIGANDDSDLCSEIISKLDNIEFINLCGKLSIRQTAKAIKQCTAIITNDTGVLHIASAVNIPIAAVFGSTVKEFGFEPYYAEYKIFEVELKCRPCTHIGRANCPKGHFNCMRLINTDSIVNWVIDRVLNSSE